MSLTVGVDSYVTVADADTYFLARGSAAWAALTGPAKEAALLQAMDYLGTLRWSGLRADAAQPLAWPRVGVAADGVPVPLDSVPVQVRHAQMELAVRASAGPLLADQGPAVKSEKVGPIAVEYADGASAGVRYSFVDALLGDLLFGGGASGQIKLVRA